MAPQNGDEPDTVSKPIGPFEDFQACVTHFEGDPDVDDPEALCGFLEQNKEALEGFSPEEDRVEDLIEALNDPEAEKVLQNLTVTHVSGVGDPAQDSAWVMAKDAEGEDADWGVNSPLVVKQGTRLNRSKATPPDVGEEDEEEGDEEDDTPEQKAWAPVLIPNETDKQGDVIPLNEIERAAHNFLANFRNIDTDHDLMAGKGVPIESWTLKQDTAFDLPDGSDTRTYPEGTWMMGVQFNDEAWERILAGELTGFSIYGEAENVPIEEIIGGATRIEREATIELAKEAGLPEEAEEMVNAAEEAGVWEAIEKAAEEADVAPWALLQSLAKAAESEDPETGTSQQPNNQSMSEQTEETETEEETKEAGEGEETPDVAEMVKSIKSTVEENNEDLNEVQSKQSDLEDRVSALEEEVNKEDSTEEETEATEEAEAEKEESTEETETESEEAEKGEETTEESTEESKEVTEDPQEAAEKAVKDALGIEGDLPEDPEERREVVRKAVAEPGEGGSSVSDPLDWGEDDLAEVL